MKKMPEFMFTFAISFIHKIFMPVLGGIEYCTDETNINRNKVIVFSHGMGANMNCYSSICGCLASKGYTIVSVNHVKDEIYLDYRVASESDPKLIR